jgi:hypothetical protein
MEDRKKGYGQAWLFYASTVAFFSFFLQIVLMLFASLVYRKRGNVHLYKELCFSLLFQEYTEIECTVVSFENAKHKSPFAVNSFIALSVIYFLLILGGDQFMRRHF